MALTNSSKEWNRFFRGLNMRERRIIEGLFIDAITIMRYKGKPGSEDLLSGLPSEGGFYSFEDVIDLLVENAADYEEFAAVPTKVTYYEVIDISGSTGGSITSPTGATIVENQFGESGSAVLSTLTGSSDPTYQTPQNGAGDPITVNLATDGTYLASDLFGSPVALIYTISIPIGDIESLDLDFVIDYFKISPAREIEVTPSGNLTSDNVQDALEELQSDIDGISTSGVQSVTGPDVDNTDPDNPIVNRTDAADVPNFDTEVENNTEVAANTADRHTQNTDTALATGQLNEVTATDVRNHLDNDGIHVPAGGTAGQILTKQSNADGDTDWDDAPQTGVLTVTGPKVDNTDPANPVVLANIRDRGIWSETPVDPYKVNDQVTNRGGLWLCLLDDTTEEPAISPVGDAGFVFTGTYTDSPNNGKQVIAGQRYTAVNNVVISAIRIQTIIGNTYELYWVSDPLGSAILEPLINFTASITGESKVAFPTRIVGAGQAIDFIARISQTDPAPTTESYNYNYTRKNSNPIAGEITQGNGANSKFLKVHKEDDDAIDRSAFLATLTVGDIIGATNSGESLINWAIQDITDNGTFITFQVAPEEQISGNGLYVFEFSSTSTTTITIAQELNTWVGNPNVRGLFALDDSYDGVVINDNQYLLDIQVQQIAAPSDWRFLAGTFGDAGGAISVTQHSQLELNDGPNPHGTEASDVPSTPAGTITSTNVQDALEELDNDIQAIPPPFSGNHSDLSLNDGANPHGTTAGDVPVTPTGNLTSTDAQAAFEELQGDIDTINSSSLPDAPADGNNYVRNNNAWVIYRGLQLAFVDFGDSPIAAVPNTRYIVDTSGGDVVVNIPDAIASNENEVIAIYKETTDLNDVTVQTVGSQPIGGQTTQVITESDKGFTIKSGGVTRSEWFIIQDSREREPYYTIPFAAIVPFDGLNGPRQKVTVTANIVIQDPINLVDGADIVVKVIQNAAGSNTVSFENAWRFPNGILNVSQESNAVTIIRGIYDATTDTVDVHSVSEDTLPELHFGTYNLLSLWYTMTDDVGSVTVRDRGPLQANGVAVNSPTFGVSGYFRSAVEFNGINQYITNLNASITDPLQGSSSWALHLRASADAPLGVFRVAASISDPDDMNPDDTTVAIYPYTTTGGLTNGVRVWYNGSFLINFNNGPAANGTFNSFFLVQRSPTVVELWINGVLEVTANPGDSLDNGISEFIVGSFDTSEEYYDGKIDDVRLFADSTDITATVIPLIQNVASF